MEEKEKLKQFWIYSFHPITGFKWNRNDKYTLGEVVERKKNIELKRKFNN